MRLYKINILCLGKDLDRKSISHYTLADNDLEIYKHIAELYFDGYEETEDGIYDSWAEIYGDYDGSAGIREEILKKKNDFNKEYVGEFYDIKYGWEDLGEINVTEQEVLEKFGILELIKLD